MATTNEPEPTGNPVFDYRANYRVFAQRLQSWLILRGLLLLVIGGITALLAPENYQTVGISLAAGGVIFVVGGVWWGFRWRNKLRAEFRKEYGGGQ